MATLDSAALSVARARSSPPGAGDDDEANSEASATCRICFDGTDSGELVAPCGCSGTQAFVHESCLLRWRRMQLIQGKTAAAARCEICGCRYPATLNQPMRPTGAVLLEFGGVLLETAMGLAVYACSSGPRMAFWAGLPCLLFSGGTRRIFLAGVSLFPFAVGYLYSRNLKLSVLGSPGQRRLGLSSFGAPVEGLCQGMLLVFLGAGGPFERTVLYVMEHSDFGSLAVILNKPVEDRPGRNVRYGGPMQLSETVCIHDVPQVPGAQKLLRGEEIFLTRARNVRDIAKTVLSQATEHSRVVLFKGMASWGRHQLEGEVRRSAWGWIRPEDIRPQDLLETDRPVLGGLWERLVNSPSLQIFHE